MTSFMITSYVLDRSPASSCTQVVHFNRPGHRECKKEDSGFKIHNMEHLHCLGRDITSRAGSQLNNCRLQKFADPV